MIGIWFIFVEHKRIVGTFLTSQTPAKTIDLEALAGKSAELKAFLKANKDLVQFARAILAVPKPALSDSDKAKIVYFVAKSTTLRSEFLENFLI